MKLKRNIITPYLTFLFIVVGLSGVLMFFHILDEYTTIVHEVLGLAFVIFSVFHIIINWKSLESHFKKTVFVIAGIVILIFSVGFIITDTMHVDHERIMIERVVKAPIAESFNILNLNHSEVEKILEENNIVIGESKTIEEISINNHKSIHEIIELLIK